MPNKRYIAGRDYEYKVMRQLREQGFYAIRSAGSHGYFDIIGIKPGTAKPAPPISPDATIQLRMTTVNPNITLGEIRIIQCKTGKSKKHAIDKVVMSKLAEQFDGLYTVKVEVL